MQQYYYVSSLYVTYTSLEFSLIISTNEKVCVFRVTLQKLIRGGRSAIYFILIFFAINEVLQILNDSVEGHGRSGNPRHAYIFFGLIPRG